MIVLLSRNRVKDFDRWKVIFDAQEGAGHAAGLHLLKMWTALEDKNNVFFTFEVQDIEKARAFLNDPKSAEIGEEAGVIDGEYHFLNEL